MRLLPAAALLFAGLAALAPPLAATDWYVSTLGDDAAGDGSPGNPWRSVTRAMVAAGAGDRILVAAGTYDPVHGESFPIVVKDGVAVLGPVGGIATLDGANVFVPLLVVADNAATTVLQHLRLDGEVNIIEVFGNPADLQVLDCVFLGGRKALNHQFAGGPAALTFDRNLIQGMDEDGLNWEASGGDNSHVLNLRDNLFSGKSLSLHGVRVTASGDADLVLDLSRNSIEKYGVGCAIEVSVATADSQVTGLVAGNELRKCDDQGLLIDLAAAGVAPGLAAFHAVLRHNELTKNGKEGARIRLAATGSGNQAVFDPPVYGNSFVANDDSGFYLSDAEAAGGVCSAVPDLGGGGASWGGNTFRLNDNAYATGIEYDLRWEAGEDVPARHNWWGTGDPLLIESHVFHQVDDPSAGLADFAERREKTLRFHLAPPSVRGTGGQFVTAVAEPGTVFVERAGVTPLTILAGSRRIWTYTASADGRRVRFRVPGLRAQGRVAPLSITDAAGHTGAAQLQLEGDHQGGGFCFVATAAYGDYDAPEVKVLRRWRDECLRTNAPGRAFVRAYYRLSPPLAAAIAERPWARALSRALLAPLVAAAWLWLAAPWACLTLLVLAAAAWRGRRQRRRPRRVAG